MPRKHSRNPNQFTTDQIRTADLLITEGTKPHCAIHISTKKYKGKRYRYVYLRPRIAVRMCDRPALEPMERFTKSKIHKATARNILCPPEDFPPHGKGIWSIELVGNKALNTVETLRPLLTPKYLKAHQQTKQKCGHKPRIR